MAQNNVALFDKKKNYATITQDELHAHYKLEQAFIDARDRYKASTVKLVLRMNAGAQQQPGKFALRKKLITRRHMSWKEVCIEVKGQRWVDNRLHDCRPTHSYKLEFADVGPKGVGGA